MNTTLYAYIEARQALGDRNLGNYTAGDLPALEQEGVRMPAPIEEIFETLACHPARARLLLGDDGAVLVVEPDWTCRDEFGDKWTEEDESGPDWRVGDGMDDDRRDRVDADYYECMRDTVDDWSDGTFWASWRGYREGLLISADGDIDRIDDIDETGGGGRVDPPEPECPQNGEHDWVTPHALVGGLKENPGVHGHGGGVTVQYVCRHCGCGKLIDTWVQDPSTGVQGLESVEYTTDLTDEVIHEWFARDVPGDVDWDELESDADGNYDLPGLLVCGDEPVYLADTDIYSVAEDYRDACAANGLERESPITVAEVSLEWMGEREGYVLRERNHTEV